MVQPVNAKNLIANPTNKRDLKVPKPLSFRWRSCIEGKGRPFCEDCLSNVKNSLLKFWLWLKTSLLGPAPLIHSEYVEVLERIYTQLEQNSFDPVQFQRLASELQLAIQAEFINLKVKTSYFEQMNVGGKDFKRAVDLLKTKYRLEHLEHCHRILGKDHIDVVYLHRSNPYRKAYKMLPVSLQKEVCFRLGKTYSERYKNQPNFAELGKELIQNDPRISLLTVQRLISEEKNRKADLLL